jgi:hypothetical protein
MDENKPPPQLVRFDFPPGATPKQIAEALTKAREELRAEKKGK